jgi:hypothetical protein
MLLRELWCGCCFYCRASPLNNQQVGFVEIKMINVVQLNLLILCGKLLYDSDCVLDVNLANPSLCVNGIPVKKILLSLVRCDENQDRYFY